jgi:hypothetical protein
MTDLSNPLVLAIRSRLPLIHVTTDDTVNIKEVLSFLAGNDPEGEFEEVKIAPISLPKEIKNTKELNLPRASTSSTPPVRWQPWRRCIASRWIGKSRSFL